MLGSGKEKLLAAAQGVLLAWAVSFLAIAILSSNQGIDLSGALVGLAYSSISPLVALIHSGGILLICIAYWSIAILLTARLNGWPLSFSWLVLTFAWLAIGAYSGPKILGWLA